MDMIRLLSFLFHACVGTYQAVACPVQGLGLGSLIILFEEDSPMYVNDISSGA